VPVHRRGGYDHLAPLLLADGDHAVRHARRYRRRRHAGRACGARDLWGRSAACEARRTAVLALTRSEYSA
jgi:hypothetical protein